MDVHCVINKCLWGTGIALWRVWSWCERQSKVGCLCITTCWKMCSAAEGPPVLSPSDPVQLRHLNSLEQLLLMNWIRFRLLKFMTKRIVRMHFLWVSLLWNAMVHFTQHFGWAHTNMSKWKAPTWSRLHQSFPGFSRCVWWGSEFQWSSLRLWSIRWGVSNVIFSSWENCAKTDTAYVWNARRRLLLNYFIANQHLGYSVVQVFLFLKGGIFSRTVQMFIKRAGKNTFPVVKLTGWDTSKSLMINSIKFLTRENIFL